MPDFNKLRNELNKARNQKENSKQALFLEKERLAKVRREKEALQRVFDKSKNEHVQRLRQLKNLEENTKVQIEEWNEVLKQQNEYELGVFRDFTVFTDPREHISLLNDNYPILLLPVRIETRFKIIEAGDSARHQLWVRIFPDDCAIDTFESVPSEMEIENTRFYWSTSWQAGGIEAQERAAWRSLVASHGSGRSAWLIKSYRPENWDDQPKKDNNQDIILVISVLELPPASDRKPILEFWKAYWLANGNKELQQMAYANLTDGVGATLAEKYFQELIPDNLKQNPPAPYARNEVKLDAIFLDFPAPQKVDTKLQSWTQAPKTKVMPDRFVLMGYENETVAFEEIGNPIPSPLITGPDPSLEKEDQIKQENGELQLNDQIKWLIDFDEAIAKGMGFKINITELQATRGFTRMIALGVKISSDKDESAELMEELIDHHKNSRKGFSLLPQGTPTNNTEKEGAGYQSLDDPDRSFDYLQKEKLFDLTSDLFTKKDGQWLAESLGLSDDIFQNMMYSDGTDQCEARAMNRALWPATMGYMMESLMHPVFNDQDIETTRDFFNAMISGRGTVPAIKIGKQPYGIYPTTAFSEISWIKPRGRLVSTHLTTNADSYIDYLQRLYQVLKKIDQDWTKDHFSKIPFVGKSGDAHQILLDAVGLNAQSVEFYQRYAESFEELYNRLSIYGFVGAFLAQLAAGAYVQSGKDLLSSFGHESEELPDILEKLFLKSQNLLKGPLIDDVPLSENSPIRNYTTAPASANYIRWLINAASTSHDTLRKQEGFIDDKTPSAMLYLMLHHALDLNFIDVSLKLHLQAEIMNRNQVRAAKVEPTFLHVAENVKETESKWQYLYKTDNRITENFNGDIGTYIPQIINTKGATAYLKEQLEALEHLENVPTARLERVFVEHIDLCTYRLDAWKNGIMNYQLFNMRQFDRGEEEAFYNKGLYIGAFGILEDVKSEDKELTPIHNLEEDLQETFLKSDQPLYKDDTNAGYIAAPSLNHAVTAAVLRNGYLENATPDNPDLLSVNLSSERVRKALSVIEGIRAGQSLAELLGYQLERGLHDNHPSLELDFYIYELRRVFSLRANRNKDTQAPDDTPIENVEARNVIDGLRLINHLKTLPDNAEYPYEKNISTDGLTQSIKDAISAEVNNIRDINDAISDVAIAESVHQVVQGNYDRGAASLNTYSKGAFPPIPDVIQTPRSGINITQRVGIHLESGVDHTISPTSFPMTPRAQAEPALNKWLASILPPFDQLACKVVYFDYADTMEKEATITMTMLQVQPIDLLYLLNIDMDQAIAQLDDMILQYTRENFNVRPDAKIMIKYLEKVSGISLFEVSPMIESLHNLVLNSRALESEDVARPTEEKPEEQSVWILNKQRIEVNRNALQLLKNDADGFHGSVSALTETETPDITQIINQANTWSDDLISILKSALKFGNPQASLGIVQDGKAGIYTAMIKKLNEIIDRLQQRSSKYDDWIATLAGAANDEEKIDIMIKAEREISSKSTIPIPATSAAYQVILDGKKTNFDNKLNNLSSIVNGTNTSVTTLYQVFTAELPLTDFDTQTIDVEPFENQFLTFARELVLRAANLSKDLDNRIKKVDALLIEYDAASESKKQVNALQNAGMAIFGDDFKMFHEFTLPEKQADEWENSFNDQAQLLDYSINQQKVDFPLDDWLYGLARVREKMHHWENINFINEALSGSELAMQPIQLPYKPNDHWLALDYPEDYGKDEEDYTEGQEISKDKLLYTALYATPFDKSSNQCGILIDEWTELIPSKNETAGITFHFDRPNAEPPQVMLLALPTDFRGEWRWQDLVDTINETLEMAKKRAIEPDQVDDSSYARFLPATVSSTTTYPITASLNFAFNNQIQVKLNQNGD